MKHTFYRPTEVNCQEMQTIVTKLKMDFQTLIQEDVSKEGCMDYAQSVVATGLPLPKDPTMTFWGLQDPRSMPSDARVEFFYMPTYYTVAMLIYMLEQGCIDKESIPEFETVFCGGLKACAGRHMMGHGYESTEGLLDALEIFQAAGAFAFCKKHPNTCPTFVECLLDGYDFIKHSLATNRTRGEWGTDYAQRMASLVELVENVQMGFVITDGVLKNYTNAETEVIVPEGVTEIGGKAFRDCQTVVSVQLPSTVTAIGRGAFCDCTALETICIPDGITVIDEYTFAGCDSLHSVTLPASLKRIEANAFLECAALEEIEIPEGVEYIMEDAFYDCIALKTVMMADTVRYLGGGVFEGCTSLKDVVLSANLKCMEMEVFQNCTSLERIRLPETIATLGRFLFIGCTNLKTIEIPESVRPIWEDDCSYAFDGCDAEVVVYETCE
ncbi:leucine-rich repeat domain-containing protein [Bengtsoniella intestinalis]|uniref:leucine-rich repeat domain-containing protein n=1 Tax=Bengtsoniella intestinalis TaxID=3073143 RepID=UPI00391F8326